MSLSVEQVVALKHFLANGDTTEWQQAQERFQEHGRAETKKVYIACRVVFTAIIARVTGGICRQTSVAAFRLVSRFVCCACFFLFVVDSVCVVAVAAKLLPCVHKVLLVVHIFFVTLVVIHQVFSTLCSKLMGPLFQILPARAALSTTVVGRPSPLYSAAKTLVCEALFHEEHLEGYREAFAATEAAGVSLSATVVAARADDDQVAAAVASETGGKQKKKKRRKKNKGGGDGGEDATTAAADAGGNSGGKNRTPRRVCYQQQLFDEMATLCGGGGGGGSHVQQERSCLGAMAGAPLLLEGYITRLGRTQQREATDIHEASGTALASAVGGKRSRSSGGGGGGGGTGGGAGSFAPSPASQMFRLWAVLTSTLSGSLGSASRSPPPSAVPSSVPPSSSFVLPLLLLLPYLRSSNSMLRLLADHDVYRINEDWGGLEFDQLRSFSASLIRLAAAAAADDIARRGGGRGDFTDVRPRTAATAPAAAMVICSDDEEGKAGGVGANEASAGRCLGSQDDAAEGAASTAAAQEFLKAFTSLLGLNHNILHDDLRPVLRMTFEWAAAAEAGATATEAVTAKAITANGGGGGGGLRVLRSLAIGLVVRLVDTYGRLRQMDHLVRALFGAIADRPSPAAAVLRRDECTAALGR